MVKAVRGAISVDSNDHKSMEKAVIELMNEISGKNDLKEEEIISIVFSQTADLNVANPAAALRKSGAYHFVPLFCTKEPEYEGALHAVVRVLVTYQCENDHRPVPVYLGEAVHLRKDLNSAYEC
ncbi:chorismate mutase [Spirochaeta isovalerica]|uniref:chorismate mutase n=1 Tax=Spirochaeta isovalerica TaxID=150 RepID=A0A841R9G1_9SPIO|nr:chorismate mutase [Spirochaeta isovalerica]MBB6479102.1 chorismate mutase [Spirochaeta isovalerica]